MELLIPIFAIIGFFGAIISFNYMFFKSRHRERMALIENGTSAEIFAGSQGENLMNALKYGMLLVGAGLGFYAGVLSQMWLGVEEGLGVFPLTLVGGGLGLILYYKIASAKQD